MNASPLICMMKAGIVEILPALFREIAVPQAVSSEILVKGKADPQRQATASYHWIKLIKDVPVAPQVAFLFRKGDRLCPLPG